MLRMNSGRFQRLGYLGIGVLVPIVLVVVAIALHGGFEQGIGTTPRSQIHISKSSTGDDEPRNVLAGLTSKPAPVDAEARAVGSKLGRMIYTQCGGSLFAGSDEYLWEYRGGRLSIDSLELSKADRLNGIEWNGTVELKYSAYRHRENGAWTNWLDPQFNDWSHDPNLQMLWLSKRAGVWYARKYTSDSEVQLRDLLTQLHPVSCPKS